MQAAWRTEQDAVDAAASWHDPETLTPVWVPIVTTRYGEISAILDDHYWSKRS